MEEPKQATVIFSGHVQGVGFRFATRSIASHHPVTGYVRNLPGGEVEIVAQGQEPNIRAFLDDVRKEMAGYIQREHESWAQPLERFSTFRISL